MPAASLDDDRLLAALDAAVVEQFGMLRRTVQKNLAVLTLAVLRLLGAARGGAGRLSLAALGRVLPTLGTPHAREKRLARVLANPRLAPRGVTDGLARVIAGRRRAGSGRCCVIKPPPGARKPSSRASRLPGACCPWRSPPLTIRGRRRPP